MIGGTRYRISADVSRQAALAAQIARGQGDIASGTRLRSASDDPAASVRASLIERARIDTAAWRTVAAGGAALAARADTALGSAQAVLDSARDLLTTSMSGIASDADRITAADALRGMADDLDALSLTLDASGTRVFPENQPLALPVGANTTIVPTLSVSDAFTDNGRSFAFSLREAALALTQPQPAPRDAALTAIVAAVGKLADARATIGGRAARLDAIAERLSDGDVRLREELSTLTDTDVPATVARIQADQLALDASRALFARVNRSTLFDLLG